jgi:hypothetical protein
MRFPACLEEGGDVVGREQASEDEPDQVAPRIDLEGESGVHRDGLAGGVCSTL